MFLAIRFLHITVKNNYKKRVEDQYININHIQTIHKPSTNHPQITNKKENFYKKFI